MATGSATSCGKECGGIIVQTGTMSRGYLRREALRSEFSLRELLVASHRSALASHKMFPTGSLSGSRISLFCAKLLEMEGSRICRRVCLILWDLHTGAGAQPNSFASYRARELVLESDGARRSSV